MGEDEDWEWLEKRSADIVSEIGISVFDPAFKELKEEKDGVFTKKHGEGGDLRFVGEISLCWIESWTDGSKSRNPSESQILDSKPNIHTNKPPINHSEPKNSKSITAESITNQRSQTGTQVEKGSWWKGMGIWARDKDLGQKEEGENTSKGEEGQR